MFKFSLKRFIAAILVVAMIFTSTGFAVFAESIDDMDITMNSAEVSLASPSYTEGEEDYSGEYEEEPEDDETKTLTKLETDEISCENDETTIVESSEEETSTTGESNLVDANDTTSIINLDEQTNANIVETENSEIATISIVDEDIVNLVKINDEIASSSDISNDIEEKGTSILATESETILDIEKSSESEINVETALSFFGDAPLFGDAAPNTIWLGTYPQNATWQSDGSAYNIVEPIKWRKLSESGTEALYVADKILDNVSYHAAGGNITWGTSDIHSWLNDTSANGFIGKAFTTNQLDDTDGIILEKTIVTTDSADTDDKAFLLSKDEAQSLFIDNNSRLVSGTNYAKSVDNGGFHLYVSSGHSYWWLRSPGISPNAATLVGMDGGINADGYAVDNHQNGVRPAIYINLSSSLYKTSNNGVSWDLNGGDFNNDSTLWNQYTTYFGGQLLPTASNFEVPTGKHFVAMSINTEKRQIATTSIPGNQDGDITLEALWGDTEDDKAISYDFGAGSISDWSLLPRIYTPGTVKSLPNRHDLSAYITHPSGYPFAGFAKSGTTDIITYIKNSETEDITLVPVWGVCIEYYEQATDTIATANILRNTDGSGTIATYPWDVKPTWTRTGYDFVQWRDKQTGVAITDLNIAAGNMDDVEIYPEWRERPPAPDTIWLGTYPQGVTWQSDGSAYNIVEPIKWRKLSESGTEALYVADKILDNISYHAAGGSITWAGSGIHSWLNDTSATGFIGKAFTINQLDDADGIVLEKTITTTDSADTNDKAFLLSLGEVQNLITPASSRRMYGTEYAKTKVNGGPTLEVDSDHSPWWLRSPGNAGSGYAVHVRASGLIVTDGASVNSQTTGVRPAIYINLSSPLYKTSDNAVSWDLNGGSFANGSVLWSSMNTYLGGQLLPTADNFTPPTGKHFIGMSINTETQSSINTIIPDDTEGNITLRPLFGDNTTDKIINYDFGSGTFTGWSLLPGSYTPGTAILLPNKFDLARYITPPADQEFKGFAKSGTTDIITEIADTETTDIDLVAIYGDRPTITWNMGTGTDIGTLDPEVASTSYISGIEWPLPLQDKITPPIGCEFDHWILRRVGADDIEPATSIPATIDVNVEVIAVYNHLTYDITWNLADGTSTESIDRGAWNGAEGPATYTYGNGIANLPTNVTPPQGRTFDHWKLIQTETGGADINPATSVSSTQVGDVTIKAVYNKISYPITWNINGATIDAALMPAEHTYGTAIPLPNVTNVTPPEGKVFNYWLVNGTKVTSISASLVGNVTVTLVLKDKGKEVNSINILTKPTTNYNVDQYFNPAGLVLRVNYIDGSFANIAYSDANAGEFTFEPTLNIKLTADITSVSITYEGKTTVLNITVSNESPSPYYPPSGGGGNGGGSGGGGGVINAIQNQIVPTTYIDQIKTINAIINSNEIVWIYDPIVDTFKMNITTNGQTVPANSGFYLINNVVEQNINNTIINNISTNTYYFDKYGNMLTGWIHTIDDKWYFFENSKTSAEGKMAIGWKLIQGSWYYFTSDGSMMVSSITPDGFIIGADGKWVQYKD